jgi:hypothetical protein
VDLTAYFLLPHDADPLDQLSLQVILLTTALDRSGVIKNFSIDPNHTLVRPIRASTLYDLVRPSTTVESAVATGVATVNKSGKKFDNTLAKSCPLRILLVDGESFSQF